MTVHCFSNSLLPVHLYPFNSWLFNSVVYHRTFEGGRTVIVFLMFFRFFLSFFAYLWVGATVDFFYPVQLPPTGYVVILVYLIIFLSFSYSCLFIITFTYAYRKHKKHSKKSIKIKTPKILLLYILLFIICYLSLILGKHCLQVSLDDSSLLQGAGGVSASSRVHESLLVHFKGPTGIVLGVLFFS